MYSNKKKLNDIDISCLVFDNDIQGRNNMTTGSQNDWREEGLSRKRKFFVSQPVLQIFLWFSQRKETERV